MMFILWLLAVILVIAGIYVILARRDLLWGIVLIVVGLLVGPGGVSIFT
ncbi:GPGG-motif small membrane protein [Spirillospora albida]|nr:GPGG-motif small membrane protein [Spirillospora albida]